MKELAPRYIGKICEKHPHLSGERYKKKYQCVGCRTDQRKAWRKTEAGKDNETRRRERKLIEQRLMREEFQKEQMEKMKQKAREMMEQEGKLHLYPYLED